MKKNTYIRMYLFGHPASSIIILMKTASLGLLEVLVTCEWGEMPPQTPPLLVTSRAFPLLPFLQEKFYGE